MARWRMPWKVAAVSLGIAAGVLGGRSPAHADEIIRINGSGAALDMMTLLNGAYLKMHPDVRIVMEKPLGSSGATRALLAGVLDLAVSSKTLTPEEARQGAKSREYGGTPLVIVAEKSVPKTDITTAELEEIYLGKMRKWANGKNIRVVLRPKADIDTAILRGLSPGMIRAIDFAQTRPGMITAVTDPESNETVSRTSGAIGASALCSLLVTKPPLKSLSLNGVMPTAKALAERRYPLAKSIRFVTTGNPSRAVTEYLGFIYSAQGRALAERAGVVTDGIGSTGNAP